MSPSLDIVIQVKNILNLPGLQLAAYLALDQNRVSLRDIDAPFKQPFCSICGTANGRPSVLCIVRALVDGDSVPRTTK